MTRVTRPTACRLRRVALRAGHLCCRGHWSGRHRARRARSCHRRHPTGIPHGGGLRCQHPSRRRLGPASTARTSLGYSRVLAGRGQEAVASERWSARELRYLAVPTTRPGLRHSYDPSQPHTADWADALTCPCTRFYSLALARRLRRGVGSPVPSTYEDARWFHAQLWQTSTT